MNSFTNPWSGIPAPNCAEAVLQLVKEDTYDNVRVLGWFNFVKPDGNEGFPRLLAENGGHGVYAFDSASRDIADNDHAEQIISFDGSSGRLPAFFKEKKRYFTFHTHLWQGMYPGGKVWAKMNTILDRIQMHCQEDVLFLLPHQAAEYVHQYRHTKVRQQGESFELASDFAPISPITVRLPVEYGEILLPTGEKTVPCHSDPDFRYFHLPIIPGEYRISPPNLSHDIP